MRKAAELRVYTHCVKILLCMLHDALHLLDGVLLLTRPLRPPCRTPHLHPPRGTTILDQYRVVLSDFRKSAQMGSRRLAAAPSGAAVDREVLRGYVDSLMAQPELHSAYLPPGVQSSLS